MTTLKIHRLKVKESFCNFLGEFKIRDCLFMYIYFWNKVKESLSIGRSVSIYPLEAGPMLNSVVVCKNELPVTFYLSLLIDLEPKKKGKIQPYLTQA